MKKTYPQQIQSLMLKSITREEMSMLAKVLELPVGRSKAATIKAIEGALADGRIDLKVTGHIRRNNGTVFMKTLLRTEVATPSPAVPTGK